MEIEFRNSESPITISDIEEFENSFNIVLPGAYKKLLLLYNGGIPLKQAFVGTDSPGYIIHRFYSLKHGTMKLEDAIDVFQITEQVIPKELLPIAYDHGGNTYCISLSESDYGKIYIWLHDVGGEKSFVTNSLEEFLENNITYQEWKQKNGL